MKDSMKRKKLKKIIAIASASLLVFGVFKFDSPTIAHLCDLMSDEGCRIIEPIAEMLPLTESVPLTIEKDPEDPQTPDQSSSAAAHLARESDFASNEYGAIDLSNASKGYAAVLLTADTCNDFRCVVEGPREKYYYPIEANKAVTLPLSEGNGEYAVSLLKRIEGIRYEIKITAKTVVTLDDEKVPFLISNPFVDWADAVDTIRKAEDLTSGTNSDREKIDAIYAWVVKNLEYDEEKAVSVSSGYLSDLDKTLKRKEGICLDYAALTAGMLRSQGVPCQLVIGYVDDAYHAWISVYTEESGWQRMDPTLEASTGNSYFIRQYIGDGSNYIPTRIY